MTEGTRLINEASAENANSDSSKNLAQSSGFSLKGLLLSLLGGLFIGGDPPLYVRAMTGPGLFFLLLLVLFLFLQTMCRCIELLCGDICTDDRSDGDCHSNILIHAEMANWNQRTSICFFLLLFRKRTIVASLWTHWRICLGTRNSCQSYGWQQFRICTHLCIWKHCTTCSFTLGIVLLERISER